MTRGVVLRPATRADAELLLRWRNDPTTRRNSFDHSSIDRQAHLVWLERKLAASHACRIWILELAGTPVGQARVDRTAGCSGEISVSVAPDARGRGLGSQAIEEASRRAAQELGLNEIQALVQDHNDVSLKAFIAAGYAEAGRTRRGSDSAIVLRRAWVTAA